MAFVTVCPARFEPHPDTKQRPSFVMATIRQHEPVNEEGWGPIEMKIQHDGTKRRSFYLCKHCGAIYSEHLI